MGLRENEGLAIGHKVAPPPEPADAAGTERTDGETREFRGTSRWPIGAFVVMQFILIGAVVRAVTASDLVAALLAVVAASMDVIAFLHAKKYSLEVGPDGVRYVAGRAVVSMQWDEIAAVSHHGFGKTMRLRSHDNRSIEIDLDKFKRGGEIRAARHAFRPRADHRARVARFADRIVNRGLDYRRHRRHGSSAVEERFHASRLRCGARLRVGARVEHVRTRAPFSLSVDRLGMRRPGCVVGDCRDRVDRRRRLRARAYHCLACPSRRSWFSERVFWTDLGVRCSRARRGLPGSACTSRRRGVAQAAA